jgi:uncharacterized alpha-E superfamily protein
MSLILARAAENGYWLGRYLERASDFVRILSVTDSVSTELQGFSPEMSRKVWAETHQVFTGFTPAIDDCDSTSLCRTFLLDLEEPTSVVSSIRNARENARAFRETLTLEAFTLLNATWQMAKESTEQINNMIKSESAPLIITLRSVLEEMQKAIYAVCGAIDRTGSRGDAWRFLHMGTLMERAGRTAEMLRVVIPAIRLEDEAAPARNARLRAVLRTLAALESYHQQFEARLDASRISKFLMFNQEPPHAVLPCVEAINRDLNMLNQRGRVEEPTRRSGLLLAHLQFEGGGSNPDNPDALAREISEELNNLHQAITERFFTV